jgi:hypothetical protein
MTFLPKKTRENELPGFFTIVSGPLCPPEPEMREPETFLLFGTFINVWNLCKIYAFFLFFFIFFVFFFHLFYFFEIFYFYSYFFEFINFYAIKKQIRRAQSLLYHALGVQWRRSFKKLRPMQVNIGRGQWSEILLVRVYNL